MERERTREGTNPGAEPVPDAAAEDALVLGRTRERVAEAPVEEAPGRVRVRSRDEEKAAADLERARAAKAAKDARAERLRAQGKITLRESFILLLSGSPKFGVLFTLAILATAAGTWKSVSGVGEFGPAAKHEYVAPPPVDQTMVPVDKSALKPAVSTAPATDSVVPIRAQPRAESGFAAPTPPTAVAPIGPAPAGAAPKVATGIFKPRP